jgi:ribosomal protein S18 acetylase RimI-like enzyme
MEECLARASAAGARGMGLHTADFMYEAVRLYWRLGFRPAPVFDFQVPAGHAGHPAGDPSAPTAHAYVRSLP